MRHPAAFVAVLLVASTGCQAPLPESGPRPSTDGTWASPAGCEANLERGGRMVRAPGTVRLATWNLRWFPRGCPPDQDCPDAATDLDWMACTVASMQVDVLAFQEVLRSPEGEQGLAALVRGLDERTAGRWRSDVQDCGETGAQAVGFLWNADRVTLEDAADLWELNGDRRAGPRDACAARLRPGRYARLSTPEGLDVSLVSVHLDSGRRELDWDRRRRALGRLGGAALGERRLLDLDDDAVVLGDFNSMGRGEGGEVEQEAEVDGLAAELGYGFRAAPPGEAACTGYYRADRERHARTLLDHAFVSDSLTGAVRGRRVSGFCAERECPAWIRGAMPAAFERLSDHCPVLLDLDAGDRDGS